MDPKIFGFLVIFIYNIVIVHGEPSIVVVGAGPAGIAAATRLLENNFRNIFVLEAENRIGGRVNSVYFGEAVIDMGAEWCHGETNNIVYQLVKDYNILGHTLEDPLTELYHSSKKNIDEDTTNAIFDIFSEIYTADGQRNKSEGVSVGEYCIEAFNSRIYEKFRNDPEKLKIAQSCIELFHRYVLSSEGAFTWYDPSAKSDYRDCGGDLNLHWNGVGYKTILEIMMKKFPDPKQQLPIDDKISLRKEVSHILWNNSIVEIKCSDGSKYSADHVIFTPSIGVLKEKHSKLFIPELPLYKQKAIKHIGFGGVMKIAMHFKKQWWKSQNFTGITFAWDKEDISVIAKEFPKGCLSDGRLWLTEVFALASVEHNPNVLIAWVAGGMTPEIELLSDETIVQGLGYLFNKFMGHKYNISEPDSILRSSWCTNPHFKGTYSYQTIQGRKTGLSQEIELAKPLLDDNGRPIVLFAGEATHERYYSTVHGAIETGYREAERILNLYKKHA